MNARPDLLVTALHEALDKAEAALQARDKRIQELVRRLEQLEACLLELAGEIPEAEKGQAVPAAALEKE